MFLKNFIAKVFRVYGEIPHQAKLMQEKSLENMCQGMGCSLKRDSRRS